ncbi:MAG TPA: sulfite exporter TauE/SafE family protein [Pirellulales bacterium]|nr:sulfite exporter TauE/SafE family protein [Pirellulales bacterium]
MYVTPLNIWFFIAAGMGTGVLGAILGTGGGVFLIPLLLLFQIPMKYAVATSIISVVATSTAVASVNVERGTANMRLGMTLEIATSLGAIAGGLTAGWLSALVLETLFAIVLLPTAVLMWRGVTESAASASADSSGAAIAPTASLHQLTTDHGSTEFAEVRPPTTALAGRYFDPRLGREVIYQVERLWAGLGISFIAGNLSGLLGIGGGVFKVPALHLACRVPIKAAAATSNFMIGVTAAASAFLYFGRGEVRPALTSAVVVGVIIGSAVGSRISPALQGRLVKRLFAVLLVGVAVQMFVRVFG